MKYLKTFEARSRQEQFPYMKEYKEVKKISSEWKIEFDKLRKIQFELIPYFQKVIESNNLEDILKMIDILPSGVTISDAQFLFQRKYMIEKGEVENNTKVSYFNDVKDILRIFPKIIEQDKIVSQLNKKVDEILRIVIKSDNVSNLTPFYNAIGNIPSGHLIANRINDLLS